MRCYVSNYVVVPSTASTARTLMSSQGRAIKPRKPSFREADNSWQTKERYVHIEEAELYESDSEAEDQRSRIHPSNHLRRLQNHKMVTIILLLFGAIYLFRQHLWPPMTEEERLQKSVLDGPSGSPMAHHPPDFDDLILVQTMDSKLLPVSGHRDGKKGRLVIIGDVHGMKDELTRLLDKVKFDKEKDHLIFTGDLISKGPDSVGVVQLAMDLGASAVRGNHEDRVLLAYNRMHSKEVRLQPGGGGGSSGSDNGKEMTDEQLAADNLFSHSKEYKDRLLAKSFSHRQIRWLSHLPVILRVGSIPQLGDLIVVHAGLVPSLPLQRQDPYSVMNMRTIDLKTHVPSDQWDGEKSAWFKLWNTYQQKLEPRQRGTVVYGHDSKRGLQLRRWSKGLDTGCLKGGELTALVIEPGKGQEVKQRIVQVGCRDRAREMEGDGFFHA